MVGTQAIGTALLSLNARMPNIVSTFFQSSLHIIDVFFLKLESNHETCESIRRTGVRISISFVLPIELNLHFHSLHSSYFNRKLYLLQVSSVGGLGLERSQEYYSFQDFMFLADSRFSGLEARTTSQLRRCLLAQSISFSTLDVILDPYISLTITFPDLFNILLVDPGRNIPP